MKKELLCLSVLLLTGCSAASSLSSNTSEKETSVVESSIPQTTPSSTAVIYFSATNHTETIANEIAQVLDCEIYEIQPEKVYTEDDLNYNDENCRANLEQNDDSARPAIANDLSSAMNHERIFLGYPIWWGTNPRIIQTFLDTYDLTGKTIYTFCTSGGSGIETSISDLETNYPALNIQEGKRFSTSDDLTVVQEWISTLSSE